MARNSGGNAPDVDWVGVQREIELGLQRRLRRELQVEPLIICLVQPAPAGTPAYKGRADAEPDTRPAPRGRRDGGREIIRNGNGAPQRQPVAAAAAVASAPASAAAVAVAPPVAAPAAAVRQVSVKEEEPVGRTRRRRSAAVAG